MKLSDFSKGLFIKSFENWNVPDEYAQPMYNYLVHGFSPGSFFTALLANDAMGMLERSHPINSISALKGLVGWIRDTMPVKAYGSYDHVKRWLEFDEVLRRDILENVGLAYPLEKEVFMILKGDMPFTHPFHHLT